MNNELFIDVLTQVMA